MSITRLTKRIKNQIACSFFEFQKRFPTAAGKIYKIYRNIRTPEYRKLMSDSKYKALREQALSCSDSLNQVVKFIDWSLVGNKRPYAFYESVINANVEPRNIRWEECGKEQPIFICAVKDDLLKVQMQVKHYRQFGVKHFVYIDNGSGDGTYEWLEEQEDVNLFFTDEVFYSSKRDAWLRKITDIYGYDRWYLIVDSDELLVYPNCESVDIESYIRFLEERGLSSVCTIMLDMYTDGRIRIGEKKETADIINEYVYFDAGPYEASTSLVCLSVNGGMRRRIFGMQNQLVKYPLNRLYKDDLHRTHRVYRATHQLDIKLHAILLHYKFLSGEDVKYREYIKTGIHANNSAEYKRYIEVIDNNPELSFFYDKSCKWTNSLDMYNIDIFDRSFYEESGIIYEAKNRPD